LTLPGAPDNYAQDYVRRSLAAVERAAGDTAFLASLTQVAEAILRCIDSRGKLMLFGNGGSAADAQHLAAEFLSRFSSDRRPLPAIALTTDSSVLTAVGNDYGFEHIFERQVRGLGQSNDIVLAISTSGTSPNVLAGLKAARSLDISTIGFMGSRPSPMTALCDFCVIAPSDETPIIQQIHIMAGHIICGLVERATIAAKPTP
jgi:D-sedoheptulose 7-phosphate isomerase